MQGREQSYRQWVIDVVNGNVKLNREEEAEEWTHRCIYKGSFTPRLVSLGPLHHGSPHLQPMEHHKRRALLYFLDRSKHSPDVYLKSPDFLNMMLLDGCFLLELHRTTTDEDTSGYTDNDPVFGPNRADFFADNKTHDLVLLENQIPLLVLQTLLDPLGGRSDAAEAHKVAYERLWKTRSRNHKKVPSATALHDAGVKFQVSPNDANIDIIFDDGVLKLPYLVITPAEKTFLLNVMAFEQLHVDMDNPISSFIKLLDDLIDTAKDVQLLVDRHRNLWRARFVNTHLRDPWTVIALLVAGLQLCLTLIQTVYSVLSYIK
ncbi:UPF0481 protein At3g47200-like [Amborella trichopoda]|uniref:UPF0481 protein At3g47200-like n=1 Tax=Amborella trichopoda TaxID=13333 RepID=UPI0009C19AE9|nr:UPF0481 protein At3g47200-like [Amborella trichopoda]|eukprot:XP_020529728.1 UPF0481 protein At3g47200-like [Amborella trichopoda]